MDEPHGRLNIADLAARIQAFGGLALLAVTCKLWTPQQVYPQVPLLAIGHLLPAGLDWLTFALLILGLATIACRPNHGSPIAKSGWAAWLLGFALLVLTDQHRLQPWAWQLAIAGAIACGTSAARSVMLYRALIVSIYFFAAISKFDYVFLHGLGVRMLRELLSFIGIQPSAESDPTLALAALILPLGELLVAILLAIPKTRRLGVVAAGLMHGTLILLLGPLGLGHAPGVLVWNLALAALNIALFWPWPSRLPSAAEPQPRWQPATTVVIAIVLLLPLLEPLELYDHWLGWGLYAPASDKALLYLPPDSRAQFANNLHPFLEEQQNGWWRVRLDRWSLATLSVPIYPEGRFDAGAASEVLAAGNFNRAIVIYQGRANRFTGARSEWTLQTIPEIDRLGKRFLLVPEGRGRLQLKGK